ncbi:bifunctional 2-C-methyl-D-erythritol 4-phosphate cytidylyltransferase/2-C-methyl-D-erythritol 2,4-cyclodiphosphate synthase [Marivivens donghaensis]|uniref:Bifunctional enzyme IspD/IspF n=1 Tax=Marivivens donghaensis TaxID=1699413 RepID=A0ABX0VYR6_9RHOB|nr:bifunctional 2-C-methyl-D-erythritol 4-phosphate cytidylyltransferase/2-C-methyl-D-erythritol 2,4-cyclodiphosphate synthase [Marivivens donghaensis]NIY72930.1 bifunctional 2-C-methyl-D-erythritol 4-phosphate cytidylyltransferase/2-C-methyl-D-erythritol 2,4-cyclodiphosphate synthase [Marivivens donghaensis]
MNKAVIIVAAGRGVRAGGDVPKQWRIIQDRTVLSHTLERFASFDRIVVVLHPDDMHRAAELEGCTCVAGGVSRDASVRNGLEALATDAPDVVLIHDAARPLVSEAVITRVVDALSAHDGAAPAVAVTDALWVGKDGNVDGTQDRTNLFRAQTPQGFRFDKILDAHRNYSGAAADDVQVARAAGLDVLIVEGDEANIKITGPDDFARAERHLGAGMDIRTGNGYDVHAFTEGDHVWLCGVKVPHTKSLKGHSDADVGMHAVTDAIYGALGMGDIGQHFPPSDPQWKGAASHIFLEHACKLARDNGFTITHVDCTLICEAPKVGPHHAAMKSAMATIMGLSEDRVSVKATTSEKLGFTGREEGIASIATATLVKL